MHGARIRVASIIIGVAGVAGVVGVAGADPAGVVTVPVVGEHGRPVYCATNRSGGLARPRADGGYEVRGLVAGRHVLHLELADERVDVLVTVATGEDVMVPPVVVRGPCREVSLRTATASVDEAADAALPAWTLEIGRTYQARPGLASAVLERDRVLVRIGAAQASRRRGPFTRGL